MYRLLIRNISKQPVSNRKQLLIAKWCQEDKYFKKQPNKPQIITEYTYKNDDHIFNNPWVEYRYKKEAHEKNSNVNAYLCGALLSWIGVRWLIKNNNTHRNVKIEYSKK